MVSKLGIGFPLPIEVVPFAVEAVRRELAKIGEVTRRARDGAPFVTDNGNAILDVRFRGGIEDPVGLEAALDRIPGVVETGLFIGLAHRLVVGTDDGNVTVEDRPRC